MINIESREGISWHKKWSVFKKFPDFKRNRNSEVTLYLYPAASNKPCCMPYSGDKMFLALLQTLNIYISVCTKQLIDNKKNSQPRITRFSLEPKWIPSKQHMLVVILIMTACTVLPSIKPLCTYSCHGIWYPITF